LEHKRQKYVTIYQIDAKWALEFYDYLTTDKRYSLDTSRRTIKVISMILDFAIIRGDLAQNPLKALRFAREKPKKIVYLTEPEIAKLENCPYFDDRLQAVVDAFLFQIHTGLAYSDLLQFKPEKHITTDEDGTQWILLDRQKTGTYCQIPVTRKAQDLLAKYANKMPIITNQRMNEYLKEAAVIAGISTELSTHVGRRTAGTYFLNRGVPMEIVSKILGHKSIKVTEAHYAHLQTRTVKNAFRNLGLL
jgi:integrase